MCRMNSPFFTSPSICRVLLSLLVVGVSSPVWAATTTTWLNSGATDFNLPANWSGGSLPGTAINDVASFGGTAAANPTLTAGITVGIVQFESGASGYNIASPSFTLSVSGTIKGLNTSGTNTVSGPINFTGTTVALSQAAGGVLNLSGNITGTSLTSFGLATNSAPVVLSGDNNYAGITSLNGSSELRINSATAIGTSSLRITSSGGILDNTSGAAITLTNNNNLLLGNAGGNTSMTFNGTHSLSFGSGKLTLNFDSTARIGTVAVAGNVLSLGGITTAGGNTAHTLTKSGAGTLAINGAASSWTGNTNLTAGTLAIGHDSALGTGTLVMANGTALEASGAARSIANNVTLNGSAAAGFTLGGSQALTLSGDVSNGGDSNKTLTVAAPSLTMSGTLNLLSGANTRSVIFDGAGNVLISGQVRNNAAGTGTGSLAYSGSGQLTLSGANVYTGGTSVNSGTVKFAKINSMSASGTVAVATGATLAVNAGGSGEFTNATSGAGSIGGLLAGTGGQSAAVTYTGNVALGIDTTNAGGSFTYSGVIANKGTSLGVTKLGTGTLVLTNTNTYSGATKVTSGTLLISGAGSINASSGVSITGGTFDYQNNTTALNRNVTLNGGTFKNNSTQNFTGVLTFTSGTVAGTNLAGVALTIGSGQTLSPGNSPGTLTTAAQTWTGGGNYNWQIVDATGAAGTGFDTITLTPGQTLTINSTSGNQFNLNLWSLSSTGPDVNGNALNFDSSVNQSWTLVSTDQAIVGFTGSDQFAINLVALNGTAGFSNSINGSFAVSLGDGNTDLILTYSAIPEPNSATLVLGAIGVFVMIRRLRRCR